MTIEGNHALFEANETKTYRELRERNYNLLKMNRLHEPLGEKPHEG
jgi:hypothetical protein